MLAELNQYTGDGGKQKIKIRSTHPVVYKVIDSIFL
jgi:hypothetical protein